MANAAGQGLFALLPEGARSGDARLVLGAQGLAGAHHVCLARGQSYLI
jgi:hypothetical protein